MHNIWHILYKIHRVKPLIAGVDFRRQNLTSTVDPRIVRVKVFIIAVEP